jgi:UDP-glucose 4-epimerase
VTVLITGGLGFIGLSTARRLIDAGETVVLTQYRVPRMPGFLKDAVARSAFVEQLDVTDNDKLLDIGRRHKIDGIIHLATPGLGALDAAADYRVNMLGLLNVLEAARLWEVKRLGLASSVAVYTGETTGPFAEEMPLRMWGSYPVEAYKKAYEVIGGYYGQRAGLDIVMLRIAGIWGPLYHSMSNLPSRLVHAAVKGQAPEMRGQEVFEEDEGDLCYVKDCAQGIALLQLAPTLPNRVYNIGFGRGTKNKELAEAIRAVIPDAQLPLKPGRGPVRRTNAYMDISRIKQDTGYAPEWPIDRAVADYIAWLRAGNEQ